jgi:ABC-type sugar transport system permease subunit
MASHRVSRNYLDRRKRAGFLFVLPALLFFGCVFILPIAQSIMYSFYRSPRAEPKEFAGLSSYERSDRFPRSGPRSATPSNCCAVRARYGRPRARSGAGLNRITNLKWRNVWASMYFLPFATSLGRGRAHMAMDIRAGLRLLNYALSFVGIPPQKWLQSLVEVRPAIAVVSVWVRIGFDTMIFLAALQSVPQEYYEAADMDGASALSDCGI